MSYKEFFNKYKNYNLILSPPENEEGIAPEIVITLQNLVELLQEDL